MDVECYLDKAWINNFYVTDRVLNCDCYSNSFYSFCYEKEKTGTGVGDPKTGRQNSYLNADNIKNKQEEKHWLVFPNSSLTGFW